jgi:hypothetical protein
MADATKSKTRRMTIDKAIGEGDRVECLVL